MGGAGSARNKGLAMARGEYIWFVDSDDYVLPETLNRNIELLEKNHGDVSIFNIYYIKNDKITHSDAVTIGSDYIIINQNQIKEYYQSLFGGTKGMLLFSSVNKIFRRSLVESHHFGNQLYGEDAVFNFDVLQHAHRIIINSIDYYCYVRHNSSIIHSTPIEQIDSNRLNDELTVSYRWEKLLKIWNVKDISPKDRAIWVIYLYIMSGKKIDQQNKEYVKYFLSFKKFNQLNYKKKTKLLICRLKAKYERGLDNE